MWGRETVQLREMPCPSVENGRMLSMSDSLTHQADGFFS